MSTVHFLPSPITLLQSTTSIYCTPHLDLKAVKSNAVPIKTDVTTDNHNRSYNSDSVPSVSVSVSELSEMQSPLYSDTDSDLDDVPITRLFIQLAECQEDVLFAEKGYKKIKIISETEQGQLILASTNKNNKQTYVTIKKCDKLLLKHQISFCKEDEDLTLCVDDDIFKEKLILKYLTINNKPKYVNTIVQYVDFFDSQTDFYLVTNESLQIQYLTLKEFVSNAHYYISIGKLLSSEYQKIVKLLIWKLFLIINWLHNTMRCCNLSLSLESINVINGEFVEASNGYFTVNPSINIKLNDFSKSEVFNTNLQNSFDCKKFSLLRTNNGAQYISPQLYNESKFDARAQDMWCCGMILFEMAIGEPLYDTIDPFQSKKPIQGTGYWAVITDNIQSYLLINNLTKHIHPKMLSVISGLLKYGELKRMNVTQVLKHKWFNGYYSRSKISIKKRQKISKPNVIVFPYYIYGQ